MFDFYSFMYCKGQRVFFVNVIFYRNFVDNFLIGIENQLGCMVENFFFFELLIFLGIDVQDYGEGRVLVL